MILKRWWKCFVKKFLSKNFKISQTQLANSEKKELKFLDMYLRTRRSFCAIENWCLIFRGQTIMIRKKSRHFFLYVWPGRWSRKAFPRKFLWQRRRVSKLAERNKLLSVEYRLLWKWISSAICMQRPIKVIYVMRRVIELREE